MARTQCMPAPAAKVALTRAGTGPSAVPAWVAMVQVHGDVFRPPRFLEVLAALVGTGIQLALLVLSVILITIAGAPAPSAPHAPRCQLAGGFAWLRRAVASFVCPPRAAAVGTPPAKRLWPRRGGLPTLNPPMPTVHAAAGTLFVERGTIVTVFIICYALTSFVGG